MRANVFGLLTVLAMTAGSPQAEAAVLVDAASTAPTLIGSIVAGDSYTVTASGVVDLATSISLTFTADGTPTYTFTGAFAGFNPVGADHDVSGNSGFGAGGAGKLLGALLGTFTATPTTADFFTIGLGTTFVAPITGNLYGLVNDSAPSDNTGGYSVAFAAATTPSPVPLPASAPMFGAALLVLGVAGLGAKRRKAAKAA